MTHDISKSPSTIIKTKAQLQVLLVIALLYCTLNLIGAALAYKLVVIGPGIAPGGIFVLPLVMLLEDMIAELFGYKVARFLLWLIIVSAIIFCIATFLIVHVPSPASMDNQAAYLIVFGPVIKSGPTAILAVIVGRFINIYIIAKFKIFLHGRFFWPRSILATLFGSIASLLIYFIVIFGKSQGVVGIEKIFITDLTVRMLYATIGGIPMTFIIILLKKQLNMDVYDYETDFNPFKLSLGK